MEFKLSAKTVCIALGIENFIIYLKRHSIMIKWVSVCVYHEVKIVSDEVFEAVVDLQILTFHSTSNRMVHLVETYQNRFYCMI